MWEWELRSLIVRVLVRHKGQKAPTAVDLGISRETLYRFIRRWKIQKDDFPEWCPMRD